MEENLAKRIPEIPQEEYHSISSLATQVAAVARAKQRSRESAHDEITLFNIAGHRTHALWEARHDNSETGTLVFRYPSGGERFRWKSRFETPIEGKAGTATRVKIVCLGFAGDVELQVKKVPED